MKRAGPRPKNVQGIRAAAFAFADGSADQQTSASENDCVTEVSRYYFFFLVFLAFFAGAFFFAFFLAAMRTTPLTFRSGRTNRFVPKT